MGYRFMIIFSLLTFFLTCQTYQMNAQEFYTTEELKKLFLVEVSKRISWIKGEFVVERFGFEPKDVKIPKECPYTVTFSNKPYPGFVFLTFVFKDKEREVKVKTWGHVEVLVLTVVSSKALSKGEIFTKEGLTFQKKPFTRLPSDAVFNEEEVIGKELKTSLKPGEVIRRSYLNEPLLIKRNQEVLIVARSKNLFVKAKGKALQEGRLGDMIRVRNVLSKKEVWGKVISSNEVEVML